jgi:hypothetical protein
VPESYGKRQRNTARAKKVAAREERRLERKQRDADRAAGLIEAGTPIAPNEPEDFPEARPAGSPADSSDEKAPEKTPDETASQS